MRFTESDVGGYGPEVPADAGCSQSSTTYQFSAPAKTLEWQECTGTGLDEGTLSLTDAQVLQIVTTVEGIRTSCPPYNGCGADAPVQTLSIQHGGSLPPTVYSSDFYAGCTNAPSSPPYIPYQALDDLDDVLHALVLPPTDGGTPDGDTR